MNRLILVSFSVVAALLSSSTVWAQPYAFSIAYQGAVNSAPDINDNGRIVFDGLKTVQNGVVTTVADFADFLHIDFTQNPSINNAGLVPIVGTHKPLGTGVFASAGGALTTIVAGNPGLDLLGTSINDAGQVAFIARTGTLQTVYVGSGGALTTIATTAGPLNHLGVSTSINAYGDVEFSATLDDASSAVYVGDGGPLNTIAHSTGSPYLAVYSSSINDSGTVAFLGQTDASNRGIFISQGGVTTPNAHTSGPYSFISDPFINNAGDLAFVAREDGSNANGIYLGADPSMDKLIRIGDPLFGSTLTSFAFDGGINNLGQIAFRYDLANGQRGIAVATAVPEPATAYVASAIAIGGLLLGRHDGRARRMNLS